MSTSKKDLFNAITVEDLIKNNRNGHIKLDDISKEEFDLADRYVNGQADIIDVINYFRKQFGLEVPETALDQKVS